VRLRRDRPLLNITCWENSMPYFQPLTDTKRMVPSACFDELFHQPVLMNWTNSARFFRKIMTSTASLGAQGRTEFRWGPGQETCLAPTCSNLRFFRSKCAVLKKVLVTLLELFGVPSDSTPGALCPLFRPSLRPCRGSCVKPELGKLFQAKSLTWWTTSSEWALLDFVLMLVSTCGRAI